MRGESQRRPESRYGQVVGTVAWDMVRLTGALYSGGSVTCELLYWDTGTNDFALTGDQFTVYADNTFYGCALNTDDILVEFHKLSGRWYAKGSGRQRIRATLTSTLTSGGSATASTAASGSSVTVNVYEVLGLVDPIPSGNIVFCTWYSGAWQVDAVSCLT